MNLFGSIMQGAATYARPAAVAAKLLARLGMGRVMHQRWKLG